MGEFISFYLLIFSVIMEFIFAESKSRWMIRMFMEKWEKEKLHMSLGGWLSFWTDLRENSPKNSVVFGIISNFITESTAKKHQPSKIYWIFPQPQNYQILLKLSEQNLSCVILIGFSFIFFVSFPIMKISQKLTNINQDHKKDSFYLPENLL